MLKVSKEKLLLALSVIFLGAVAWMITFDKSRPLDEWVLGQKPKTYYPAPPRDSSADLRKLDVSTRNPFTSTAKKVEGRVELPLPDVTEKRYALAGFRPLPDSRLYPTVNGADTYKGGLKMSFGKLHSYDDSAGLPLPQGRALPPMETLNDLISAIHEIPYPPEKAPEPPAEDVIIMRDGRKIQGTYVTEENDLVWFVRAGQKTVLSYNKQDIADIKRSYTAEELYEIELKKVSTDDAFSWHRLAEWCFRNGLPDKAVAALKEALRINNREFKFYQALADYYIGKNDLDSEIALYREAMKSAMLNKEAVYYRLGAAYEKLKLFPDALAYYEKAVALSPNYIEALFRLADLYRRKQDYESAARAYERIRTLRNPDRTYLEGLALLQYQTGKLAEAGQSLLEARKDAEASSEALNLAGMIALLSGDYTAASNSFLQSIYLKPGLSAGWTNLGLLYLSANLYAEAEMLFTEYADLNPIDETPYVGLAYLKWLKNKSDETLGHLQQALKMAPDSFPAHYVRGQLYFHLQQYPEAQQDFQWCLASHPSFTETLHYLGVISLYQKSPRDALKYYQAYFNQVTPEFTPAADECNFVLALVEADSAAQAKKMLAESKRLNKYVPALNISAYLDYRELNVEQTIRKFQAASALDPSNLYARNSLDLITRSASQAISVDDFNRPDSGVLGKGWSESEKYGVEISVSGKQCLFRGTQSLSKDGLTAMEKTVARAAFIKFEARLNIKPESNVVAGIYLSSPAKDRTLFIARKDQEIVYGFSAKPDAPPAEWLSFKKKAPVGENFKILLEITGPKDRPTEYQCFVDDVLCGIIPLKGNIIPVGKTQDTSYLTGVFGYGPLGREWQMAVKNTRVFEEKQK